MSTHSRFPFYLLLTIVFVIVCGLLTSCSSQEEDAPYYVKTVVGNGDKYIVKVNVPALEASVGEPSCVVQSRNGDLYLASDFYHVVLKAEYNRAQDTWSNVTVIAGTGRSGMGADDVEATQSALNYPVSITLIEDDDDDVIALLIADIANHRVRKLDMVTRRIVTIVGTGVWGSTGDGGLAKDAKLNRPSHAYYDKVTGDIFVVENAGNRIRRVFGSNHTITTVVGECTNTENKGDGGPAIEACLNGPHQFTMNTAGEWFIVDASSTENAKIRKVDMNGTISTVVGGGNLKGDGPPTSVNLYNAKSMDFSLSGEMLVADYSNFAIRMLGMLGGETMKVIAGGGSSYADVIPAKTAYVWPRSVAFARDGSDGIFYSDVLYGKIRRLTPLKCHGVKSNDASVCSGNGSCVSPDQCQCNSGWLRVDCSVTHCFGFTSNHPDVCSSKGQCINYNECDCNDGFRGHKCQRPPRS